MRKIKIHQLNLSFIQWNHRLLRRKHEYLLEEMLRDYGAVNMTKDFLSPGFLKERRFPSTWL